MWFLQMQIFDNMRALFMISNYWLCLNIDYDVWFVLKVMDKILSRADVSFAWLFSVVDNDICILNHKIVFLIKRAICSWHLLCNEHYNMDSNNPARSFDMIGPYECKAACHVGSKCVTFWKRFPTNTTVQIQDFPV